MSPVLPLKIAIRTFFFLFVNLNAQFYLIRILYIPMRSNTFNFRIIQHFTALKSEKSALNVGKCCKFVKFGLNLVNFGHTKINFYHFTSKELVFSKSNL